jgi:hypothetical protein
MYGACLWGLKEPKSTFSFMLLERGDSDSDPFPREKETQTLYIKKKTFLKISLELD